MKHTELDLIVAELMFPILVELAPTGNTIGYKEIAELIKSRNPNVSQIENITQRHIGRKLGTIWAFTKSQGCPHIGALVVSKNGECGSGIDSIISDPPSERVKIKCFDWSLVSLEFDSFLSKAKILKLERENKVIKRTKEEAAECFFAYWKTIKDEVPVSHAEAIALKDKILLLMRDGYSPEEAFSTELILLNSNRLSKNVECGYVYIGEYIDAETRLPLFNQLKIGYSSNLETRAFALGGGVSGPLEFSMIHWWEFDAVVAYAIEQALHGRFSRYRRNGEFFSNESGLLAVLADDEISNKYAEFLKSSTFSMNQAM